MQFNLNQLKPVWLSHWLSQRQLQVLDEAYKAAEEIKALEDKYFEGDKISYTSDCSKTVCDYVRSLRDRRLLTVRVNLAQFQFNSFLFNCQPLHSESSPDQHKEAPSIDLSNSVEAEILSKLQFIDSVVSKYRSPEEGEFHSLASNPVESSSNINPPAPKLDRLVDKNINFNITDPISIAINAASSKRNRSRLFGPKLSIGKEIDPDYEQEVVQELRLRRKQDKLAIRWLLILLLVPVLIQVLAKNLIFEPALGNYSNQNPTKIELSQEIREDFASKFNSFKEELEIRELLGFSPELTATEHQKQLEEKVVELWRESREHALNGLKNVLADVVALIFFIGIVYFNRNKLIAIRGFSNRAFLGLSDPVKVFLFILITDMFVGFHSAEGWAVLLEGVVQHLGLPESKVAINGFIATVPVIIDSCIKFWIFSYLTRYSPAASAIYERMNT